MCSRDKRFRVSNSLACVLGSQCPHPFSYLHLLEAEAINFWPSHGVGVSSSDQKKLRPPQNPYLLYRFPSTIQVEWNFLSKLLASITPKPFLVALWLWAEFPKGMLTYSTLVCLSLSLSCLFICDFVLITEIPFVWHHC